MKRLILIVSLIILISVAGYYFFIHKSASAAPPMGAGMPVVTYTVVPKHLAESLQAVGTLQANESATIKAEVPGLIKTLNFVEGQRVAKDSLLLQIDSSSYQADLDQAQAAYDISNLTFQRNTQLRLLGATSVAAKDEAKALMSERLGALNAAKIQLQKTQIRAPFAGVVGLRSISVGDFLDKGTTVTQIVDTSKIKVEFSVVEKHVDDLNTDKKISLSVDAWPTQTFTGKIYAIDPVVDPETRQETAKAILDNPISPQYPNGMLRPGMFAHISISMNEKTQALLIPEEAIIPQGDNMSVMCVVDGRVVIKPIKIGVRQNSMVEVLEGLKQNDIVITAGQMKVQEGMPVQSIPDATAKLQKGT